MTPLICFCLLLLFGGFPDSHAATVDPAIDFYRDIRPILMESCLSCHGGVRRKSGLSFISLADAQTPAKSGKTALVPGQPEESELFLRITHPDPEERMPGDGKSLSPQQIEKIRRWIAEGATWPVHWAFAARKNPQPPRVRNLSWPKNPIDPFVLSRLEKEKISPSPEADRRTLIRRLYLDLTGLLPPATEVEDFARDRSADGDERVVDRLLASPHFGERWGRHWLDLARYADTDGYEVDGDRPTAWHWRDWVIRAINDDMPFDQFTMEQLAGDLLPNATVPQRLATAFHRQTLVNKEGGIDKEEYRTYAVMDRVSTTATVWLGLTLACAQCHDHPYDPLKQREYYRLLALFNNADETALRLPGPGEKEFQKSKTAHDQALLELQALLKEKPESERAALKKQIEELKTPKDPATLLDVLEERKEPRQTYLLRRGDFLQPVKDEVIPPGTLAVLHPFRPRETNQADRLDLARWLVNPDNPLTARVAVNQIWMHLFGEGLVRSLDDFGLSGEAPSHPELLDWLAQEFIRRQWSRKSLIKLIVNSATYQQSSRHRPELTHRDPENRLLHRQHRYRVEAESMRDLYLDAAGLLSTKIGGASVFPPIPQDLTKLDFRSDMKWNTSKGEERYRRGMYTFFKRTLPDPNLTLFDCPDASATSVQRRSSNTPLQALAALNNEVFVEAAQALAVRILKTDRDNHRRLEAAFGLALGRPASQGEKESLLQYFEASRSWYEHHSEEATLLIGNHLPADANLAEAAAWTAATSTLLNLDEFMTRE